MSETSPEGFIRTLVADTPLLEPLLQEHIADNDELLPHVFFGDATRFFVQCVDRQQKESALTVLRHIENALAGGSAPVENLVVVSFLENLLDRPDIIAWCRQQMPMLGSWFERLFDNQGGT